MKIINNTMRGITLCAFWLLALSPITAKAQIISTVVGTGSSGHTGDGSAATAATLNYPAGITFDGSGNMYIAEFSGNYIRKVNTSGVITTFAGTGSAGSTGDGSAATSATLNNPGGLAVDGSGNLYIAEATGNRIRKITVSTGVISTIAGTGTASSTGDGSAATSATLNFPTDLAFDGSGNLYISENGGNRIRKITVSTGVISTIAGTGTASSTGDASAATSATLNNPAGIVFDGSGNLYIAENAGHRIRKITASTGVISTIAGTGTATSTGDGGAATSATVKYPRGLAFDASGNLYLSEENGSRIRVINASTGNIAAYAGTGTYGYSGDGAAALSATFNTPYGIAFNSGNLFIVDINSYVVRKVCNAPSPTVSSISYCQGVTAVPLTATGTNLLWYTTATGGTGSSTAPTPVTSTVGTTTYYVTQTPTTFGCESPRIGLPVTINVTPGAPTVTTPVTYCSGVTASALTATKVTASDTLYWYTVATAGTGTKTAPTPSTASAGTTPYYVSERSTLGCEGPRANINVVVNATPTTPTVTTPVTYCSGVTAAALTATLANPTDTLRWYTVATGGTGTTTAITPSTASAGTTSYYVSEKSTLGCEGARSAISVVVNATPGAPTVTATINYCQGVTAATLTATKVTSTDTLYWYTVATGGTGSTTAPTPSTATVGTVSYYVSERSTLGCEGARATISVNTKAIPAAPTVATPVNYCQGATAIALTATKGTASDTLYWYNSAIGGSGTAIAPIPSTATLGSTNFYVSERSTFSCEGSRARITVNINAIPSAPTTAATVNYCIGATATALTATPVTATDTLYWYTAATGGTGSTTAPTPSTATVGATSYYVSERSTFGCEGSRSAITVNINPLATAPTVVSPIAYCQGKSASVLTATKAAATDTLYWYTVATGGTGTTTAPTPSTATVGATSYYVSSKSSFGCEGSRSTITVNINALATAPTVTTPVVYCQGVTASALTATTASPSDTLYWYTVATGGTGSTTAPTPSTATAGTTNYYVSARNSFGCEGSRSLIAVTITAAPAAPTITTPVNYCVGATASALTATGTNLLWYAAATGGTGSTTAPTPTTATAGSISYYVTQTPVIGGCESPRAAIVVVSNAYPSAPTVTTPINLCVGATASALTATKATSTDTLYWYSAATGGTGTTTAPTPSTAAAGYALNYVSIKTVFGCEGPRSLITDTVRALPAKPTVTTPVTYCQTVTASALTASGSNLKWYTVASGGTSTSSVTPSTSTAGSTKYYVSQSLASSLGSCESVRDSITVVINPAPSVPTVTTPVNLCVGGPSSALTATLASSTDTLYWYTVSTGGTGTKTAPTPSTASAGTTPYYVGERSALGCDGSRTTLNVIVNALPAAPTVTTPINLCVGGPGTTLTATGSNLLWYTVATAGTGSGTAPTITTGTASSTIYYVSQSLAATSGGCEGPRAALTVNVNALPAKPTVTSPVNLCIGVPATSTTLTATGTNLLWYTASSGGTGTTAAPIPSTSTLGSTNYYVSQTSAASVGSCESPRATLVVTVNPLPVVAISSLSPAGFVFCPGKTVILKANAPTAVSYQWSAFGLPYAGATHDTFTVGLSGISGRRGVVVTDIYGCQGRDSVYVLRDTTPKTVLDPTVLTLCQGSAGLLNCHPSFSTYKFQWFKGTVDLLLPTSTNKLSVTDTGSYSVVVTNSNGCITTTDTAKVNYYPLITKPVIVRHDPILSVAGGYPYTYYQWYVNGTVIAGANSNTYTATFSGRYTVGVADANGCTSTSDTAYVNILGIPDVTKEAVKVYPNPSQGKVTIESPVDISVIVTDMTGRVLIQKSHVKEIDLSSFADGMYFFRITDANDMLLKLEKINKITAQ